MTTTIDGNRDGRWRALTLVAALQIAVLLGIVVPRVYLLTTGTEVVLDVTPVDPRSLFRGDYVIVTTPAHRPPADDPRAPPSPRTAPSTGPVFAVLKRGAADVAANPAGAWTITSVGLTRPASLAAGEIVMKGHRSAEGFSGVAYGIESYFVPEGTGKAIENSIRDKKVAVRLAIDASGNAAIKALLIDGKPVHTTSLF